MQPDSLQSYVRFMYKQLFVHIDIVKNNINIPDGTLSLYKSILRLTNRDYNNNALSDLLFDYGKMYGINIEIFNLLQHTITGWPVGKPYESVTFWPRRAIPEKNVA